jgi:anti-anti-sigma factor
LSSRDVLLSPLGVERPVRVPIVVAKLRAQLTPLVLADTTRPDDFAIEQIAGDDGSVVVRVLGECDLSNAPCLRAVLDRLADAGRPTVLDLSETEFMDCAGLSAVLAARRDDWSLVVAIDRSPAVTRLLALVGMAHDSVLDPAA